MRKFLFLFFVCALSLNIAQTIERIPGSPYPASSQPDTLYVVKDAEYSKTELLTIQTLQGILAQEKPQIFRNYNSAAAKILNDLKEYYGVTVNNYFESNFLGLMTHFKNDIDGYIICDLDDNSVNVAISLSGITNSVAITEEKVALFEYLKIPLLEDVRGKDEEWFFTNYQDEINKNILCYQTEEKSKFLADYSSFGKMITFNEPLKSPTSKQILSAMEPNSPILGWGIDEFGFVEQTSPYSIYVHAADFARNLSTLTNFNAETKQKESEEIIDDRDSAHTVCFLMSDGDNIQWILNSFEVHAKWYGSKNRNKLPIGWTIPPALSELAPTVLKSLYDSADSTAEGRDYFVAGPSGLGYIFPDHYGDEDSYNEYCELMNMYMDKADLNIVNIIGNSKKNEVLEPYLVQENIDAIFYYYFSHYSGGKGEITWINNKPVICGRYNLWDGFETESELVEAINNASTDIHSEDSYTLIPVHVWSKSVDDVVNLASQFGDHVRVVAPDRFVKLITKNIIPKNTVVEFVPNNNEDEKKYLLDGFKGTGYFINHRYADRESKIVYKFDKDSLEAVNGEGNFKLHINVANEYVVSAAPNLESTPVQLFKWSEDESHIHDYSNQTDLEYNLSEFFNNGWESVYLILEDGIKSDGYGVSLFNLKIQFSEVTTSVDKNREAVIPKKFELKQNYPNPFNPTTIIEFSIPPTVESLRATSVRLKVYDVLGREVKTLVNENLESGNYQVKFDASQLSGGVYFYKLQSSRFSETKKMILQK